MPPRGPFAADQDGDPRDPGTEAAADVALRRQTASPTAFPSSLLPSRLAPRPLPPHLPPPPPYPFHPRRASRSPPSVRRGAPSPDLALGATVRRDLYPSGQHRQPPRPSPPRRPRLQRRDRRPQTIVRDLRPLDLALPGR